MEFVVAAAVLALAGGLAYGVARKGKPAESKPAAFVCHDCGERHCQCERRS